MAEPASKLAKAELRRARRATSRGEQPGGKRLTVQFNPETLKVSLREPDRPAVQAAATSAARRRRQFVGAGTTKLALQLWFDVTAPHAGRSQRSTTSGS